MTHPEARDRRSIGEAPIALRTTILLSERGYVLKLFSRLGGLVAVVAILMAAGSLLVAPVAAQTEDLGPFSSITIKGNIEVTSSTLGTHASTVTPDSVTQITLRASGTASRWADLEVSTGSLSATKDGDTSDELRVQLKNRTVDGTADPDISVKVWYHAPDISSPAPVDLKGTLRGVAGAPLLLFFDIVPGPTAIVIETKPASINADTGNIAITVHLKRGDTEFAGPIEVSTNRGRLQLAVAACSATFDDMNDDDARTCDATATVAAGATVVLIGNGDVLGVATVEFEAGSLSNSVDITLTGDADSATAEAAAATMQAGDKDGATTTNLITVTVEDSNGNVLKGIEASGDVTEPDDDPILYSTDFDAGKATYCDADAATAYNGAQDPVLVNSDDGFRVPGTNSKGQCVIAITTDEDTALGEHVVEVTVTGIDDAIEVTITVVGPVDAITTDAEAFIEPGSRNEITASAVDEDGDAVGPGLAAQAFLIEGDGYVDTSSAVTDASGQYEVVFLAPTTGTSSIVIEIGGVQERVTLTIGTEPVVEPEPPEMMEHGFSTTLGSGVNLTTYTGSTGELAMDAAEAGVSLVAVSVDGEYITYIVGAPTFANEPFSDQFPDGLDGVIVVAVVN